MAASRAASPLGISSPWRDNLEPRPSERQDKFTKLKGSSTTMPLTGLQTGIIRVLVEDRTMLLFICGGDGNVPVLGGGRSFALGCQG
jgi:hypothetical protein